MNRRATAEQIAELRRCCALLDDEDLDRFLSAHATAAVAGHLIATMQPDARAAFFAHLRGAYPDEFGPLQ